MTKFNLIHKDFCNSVTTWITFTATSSMSSSSCSVMSAPTERTDEISSGDCNFGPTHESTLASASNEVIWMAIPPVDSIDGENVSPLAVDTSSLIRGSTCVERGISKPNAFMASNLTSLDWSDSALTNVVWNWGTKAFRRGPPFKRIKPKVSMIATLTEDGLRSPTILSKGPVILIAKGPKNSLDVSLISSPRLAAAFSLADESPYKIPRW